MFYMKDENENFIHLDDDFYYRCAGCGKMAGIDLVDTIREDPEFDFQGTAIYCPDCSKELMKR